MKFKVGDKVKFNVDNQCFATEFGFDSKGVYEVQNVFGTIQLKNDSGAYHAFNFDRLELAEPKKSKNQRITELEKRVASLLERVEVLENGPKTMRDTLNELEPLFTEPSTNQEVQHQTIQCAVAKSPNQQRVEIIEKAKKFVEENKYFGTGSNWNEIPFCQNVGHVDSTIYVNEKKRTIVAVVQSLYNKDKKYQAKGIAKCHPSDVFNEHIGKAIALGRALGLDVSEFEQAVQPTVAVGQIIEALDHDTGEIVITYEVDRISGEGYPVKKNGGLASKYRIINDTNAIYEEENK